MKYQRKSVFKQLISAFVAQKRALGYPYIGSEYTLNLFDDFCYKKHSTEKVLSKNIGLHWAERWNSEGRTGHRDRVMVIREFAKFLNSIGHSAYVIPLDLTRKPVRRVPHIYSQNELITFFKVVDSLPYCSWSPARHFVWPVYMRLLYCCGLRPREARVLLVKNIDLNTGIIKIIESKGHKDRYVTLAPDVLELCSRYHNLVSGLFPTRDYFFPNPDGTGCYSRRGLTHTFHTCIKLAGLKTYNGNCPRMYDFRHTFATSRMNLWIKEGKDVNVLLPYLSAYMGHVQLSDTAYYIHLIPDFFSHVPNYNVSKYENALPEVEK